MADTRIESAVVRVTVIDDRTSEPVSNAAVGVTQPYGNDFSVSCDAQGQAVIHIGKGLHTLQIGRWPDFQYQRKTVDTEIGKEYSVEARLHSRRKLRGNILSADGKPAGNVSVRIVVGTQSGTDTITASISEGNGRFQLEFDSTIGSGDFQPYIEAVIENYRFAAAVPLPPTDEMLNLRLQPTTTLILRTLNSKGQLVKTSLGGLLVDGRTWYFNSNHPNFSLYGVSDTHTISGLILPPNHRLSIQLHEVGGVYKMESFVIPDDLLVPGATSNMDITVGSQ
jgi:hypothetical protein